MRQATWISSALVVASMTLAGPAFAVSSAKATLSGFGYVLFDLNPNDGIDPALTVTGSTTSSTASVSTKADGGHQDYDSDSASGIWSPTTATAMLTFAHANAMTGNDGAAAEGYASGTHEGKYYYDAVGGVSVDFTLTPWTLVTFTVSVEAFASKTGVAFDESATATVYSRVTTVRDYQTASRRAEAECIWNGYSCPPQTDSFVGTLSMGYANPYDVAVSGNLVTAAQVSGVSVVPEPQIYAMLLAGLVVIGVAVGRRPATSSDA